MAAAGVAALASRGSAQANPTIAMPNGPVYQLIGSARGLQAAMTMAATSSYNNQPGTLVTPASAAENAFILSRFRSNGPLLWVGGTRRMWCGTPTGTTGAGVCGPLLPQWRWMSGGPMNGT